MHLFERIEAAKREYSFERRAGPRFAWPYFCGPLKYALALLGEFSLMVEKARLGEVPENPAYAEHVQTALEAIERIESYLGLKWLDLYLYKRFAIESRTMPYHQQFLRRQNEIIHEMTWAIRQESQKLDQADHTVIQQYENRKQAAETKREKLWAGI